MVGGLAVFVDVDAFFLEYDDERSGGFEPLRFLPKGKMVVLGLVTFIPWLSTWLPRVSGF